MIEKIINTILLEKESLNSDVPILKKIYLLKPSGTDYNLYELK